jgi:hypothetical protein
VNHQENAATDDSLARSSDSSTSHAIETENRPDLERLLAFHQDIEEVHAKPPMDRNVSIGEAFFTLQRLSD